MTDLIKKEKEILEEREEEEIEQKEEEIRKLVKAEEIENKHIYEKLLELEDVIKGNKGLKFIHIEDWKQYVWNDCEFKETKEENNLILHNCTKKMVLAIS